MVTFEKGSFLKPTGALLGIISDIHRVGTNPEVNVEGLGGQPTQGQHDHLFLV